jgi:hypothetical protein
MTRGDEMRAVPAVLLSVTLMLAAPAHAQAGRAFDARAWAGDVAVIARELPARHPDAFFRMPRERWDSATAATARQMPSLTRPEALVALLELVALVRDGHTTINPFFDRAAGVRYYPVELYQFEDGLFVRSAAPAHAALAGARVLRVGRVSADSALAAVARVIPHENEWWVRGWGGQYLGLAEVLEGLGLVDDAERLPLVIERKGRRETVVVSPAGRLSPSGHNPMTTIDRSGWAVMRDAGEPPLWLRNPGVPYWSEYLSAERALYISYRAVVSVDQPSNEAFWRGVFALADSVPVDRLVLDIRENIGGNSFYNRQVVRGILARPALDRPDRLFVITGARTFSAAMNLARDLEHWTNATFVGEPTGNAGYFFGDHVQVPLPASGLTLNVSTLTWPPYDPRDRRDFLAPSVYVPLTSAQFRANVDPAMRAIVARGAAPSLGTRVEAAVLGGDTATAERLVAEARADVANRFRSPEADVNGAGYRLVNAGKLSAALALFRINTRAFPGSANAWDSLGEALLLAGDREAGIAAYRKALDIDADFASSRQALERLGVEGPGIGAVAR